MTSRAVRLIAAAVWLSSALVSVAAAQRRPAPTPVPARPAGAAAVPSAGGAPPDASAPSGEPVEDPSLSGRGYTYDPAGRRDPFRSLLVRNDSRQPGARPPGIAGIGVDDVTVQGIWKTKSGYVAQIRGTDNKSYLLRAGDLLFDGEVTRVGPNEVGFRQNLNDPQSVKPFRDVTKQLNATIKQ